MPQQKWLTIEKPQLQLGEHRLPAEDTQDEVHDEEGAQHHHGHKVDKLPRVPLGVVDLKI